MADSFQHGNEAPKFQTEQAQPQEVQAQAEQPQAQNSEQQPSVQPQQRRGPIIGSGGDPLFRRIRATREQLNDLLEETTTIQDWLQRESCNNVALACLDNENLKEAYFEIKDGFGEYGPIMLMGFKTPQGINIPRLKVYDTDGNVLQVLTGPIAMEEINKRAIAYKTQNSYEEMVMDVTEDEAILDAPIEEYSNNTTD